MRVHPIQKGLQVARRGSVPRISDASSGPQLTAHISHCIVARYGHFGLVEAVYTRIYG